MTPHLAQLEAEAIHVIREVAAELERAFILIDEATNDTVGAGMVD